LPQQETRLEFMKRYAEDSAKRVAALREKPEPWWEEDTTFFDVRRSRAWVMTRRMTHTSHHRGQLMTVQRMIGQVPHLTRQMQERVAQMQAAAQAQPAR